MQNICLSNTIHSQRTILRLYIYLKIYKKVGMSLKQCFLFDSVFLRFCPYSFFVIVKSGIDRLNLNNHTFNYLLQMLQTKTNRHCNLKTTTKSFVSLNILVSILRLLRLLITSLSSFQLEFTTTL